MERLKIVGLLATKILVLLFALAVSIWITHLVLHFFFNTKLMVSIYIHAALILFMLVYGKVQRLY